MPNDENNKLDTFLDVSRRAWKTEDSRRKTLDAKAEKLFASILVLAGLDLFKIDRLTLSLRNLDGISGILASTALLLLTIALIHVLRAVAVRPYVSYPGGGKLLKIAADSPSGDHFRLEISKFHVEAHDANKLVNDQRAPLLQHSVWWLVAGVITAALGHILSRLTV